MTATAATAATRFVRDRATWYAWLLSGGYLFLVNVQGNVVPFLQEQFDLSYRDVSLHSSAIAVGTILVGLFGERVTGRLGRKRSLWVGVGGLSGGGLLLCLSPVPAASIFSCFLIGFFGTLIPAILPALLADIHGRRRTEAYAGQAIVSYCFGLSAPVVMGFFLWQGLGWRATVVLGAAYILGVGLWFRGTAIPEPAPAAAHGKRRLSAAFWAFWALLVACCALEYCVLFWAPAFLERVAGFDPASAATAAAAFPLGMLIGRIALGGLVRRVAARNLFFAALTVTFFGFVVYWGIGNATAAVAGLFLLGLGIAALYPLSTTFAIGAAAGAEDVASVRLAVGFGISLLLAPMALGALADDFGLGPAHLVLPALILVSYLCFFVADALQKRVARI
ncbi:MAG: MFS transporter [Bauldia sp.]